MLMLMAILVVAVAGAQDNAGITWGNEIPSVCLSFQLCPPLRERIIIIDFYCAENP